MAARTTSNNHPRDGATLAISDLVESRASLHLRRPGVKRARRAAVPRLQLEWAATAVDFDSQLRDSRRVRNYLYISDSKVDMYLPQFSSAEKRRISAKLGINVGMVEASVEGERLPLTNRIHRLAFVEEHIRDETPVGPVESGSSWFEGSTDATAAAFNEDQDVMFFFSNSESQFLGLAGSAHHIIGNVRPETAVSSHSNLQTVLDTLDGAVTRWSYVVKQSDAELDSYMHAGLSGRGPSEIMMDIADQFESRPKESISFMARRLIRDEVAPDGKRFTLGTPLYITSEDVPAVMPSDSG